MDSLCEIKLKLFMVFCRWCSANKNDRKGKLADLKFLKVIRSSNFPSQNTCWSFLKRRGVKSLLLMWFYKRLKRLGIEPGPFLKGNLGGGYPFTFLFFEKCCIFWDWIIQSTAWGLLQKWLGGSNPLQLLTRLNKMFWACSFRNFEVLIFWILKFRDLAKM